jgi:hypothetical protein
MDARLLSPLAWALGVVLLIGLLGIAIVLIRRKTITEAGGAPSGTTGPADWVGLLAALQGAGLPARQWPALAPVLSSQAPTCPPALRAPLVAALDGAIARCQDPLVSAAMGQVRRALATVPAA